MSTKCKAGSCGGLALNGDILCPTCRMLSDAAQTRNKGAKMSIDKEERANGELSGGDVNYYLLEVKDPKRLDPYTAECEDIIEALEMTFAEGNILKALWRSCNMRVHGHGKRGQDLHGIYDGDKIAYYGERVKAQRQRKVAGQMEKLMTGQPPVPTTVPGGVAKVPVGIPKTFEVLANLPQGSKAV